MEIHLTPSESTEDCTRIRGGESDCDRLLGLMQAGSSVAPPCDAEDIANAVSSSTRGPSFDPQRKCRFSTHVFSGDDSQHESAFQHGSVSQHADLCRHGDMDHTPKAATKLAIRLPPIHSNNKSRSPSDSGKCASDIPLPDRNKLLNTSTKLGNFGIEMLDQISVKCAF